MGVLATDPSILARIVDMGRALQVHRDLDAFNGVHRHSLRSAIDLARDALPSDDIAKAVGIQKAGNSARHRRFPGAPCPGSCDVSMCGPWSSLPDVSNLFVNCSSDDVPAVSAMPLASVAPAAPPVPAVPAAVGVLDRPRVDIALVTTTWADMQQLQPQQQHLSPQLSEHGPALPRRRSVMTPAVRPRLDSVLSLAGGLEHSAVGPPVSVEAMIASLPLFDRAPPSQHRSSALGSTWRHTT